MREHRTIYAALGLLFVGAAIVAPARADLSGAFARFQNCPWQDPEAYKCIYSVSYGGKVALGSRTVPIERPVVIQAGVGESDKTGFASFVSATNGITMTKVPQTVPGGLLGIVTGSSVSPLIQVLTAALFENDLLGLHATLELTGPIKGVEINGGNLRSKTGVSLKLPIRVHLENPFLGPACFVGSADEPIIWNLTTGKTNPPPPNKSMKGSFGTPGFLAEGLILKVAKNKLVDNAWGAPSANGCGGTLASLINPMVNAQLKKAKAGHNATFLESTIEIVSGAALKYVEEGRF